MEVGQVIALIKSFTRSLKSEINGKYAKPSGGIPSSDMTDAVQTSLGKANSSYQKPSGGIPGTDLADSYIKEPSSDGTNGQVLTTDGNGGRSWTDKPTAPVQDVKLNDASCLDQNGNAIIPVCASNRLGLIKPGSGLYTGGSSGVVVIQKASGNSMKNGVGDYEPITPAIQHTSVFYGLSKVAGYDLKNATVTDGTYPAESIDKILQMLGVFELIAQHETTPSTHAYAQGECFIFNGKLCRATTAISVADSIAIGTNCEQTTLMAEITR